MHYGPDKEGPNIMVNSFFCQGVHKLSNKAGQETTRGSYSQSESEMKDINKQVGDVGSIKTHDNDTRPNPTISHTNIVINKPSHPERGVKQYIRSRKQHIR